MLLQLTDHLLDESRRHREGDPDAAARRREDCGVHTDDLAIKIEGRTVRASAPIRVAGNLSPFSSVTEMSSASSTTWLLVTRYPSGEMKKREPCAMVGCG